MPYELAILAIGCPETIPFLDRLKKKTVKKNNQIYIKCR